MPHLPSQTGAHRKPPWLRRPLAHTGAVRVDGLLDELELHTVCESARCPNRGECFGDSTATFLILGDACTRDCRFCAIEARSPEPPDPGEPGRVADAAVRLGLAHVVVTMVTRDDLPDGGASHVVAVIEAVRATHRDASVEVLTSDFGGDLGAVATVVRARPDVFNHNVETVPRLYADVRSGADYERSIAVLEHAGRIEPDVPVKSGLMLGLGEEYDEIIDVMADLRAAGVTMLTLGQYLRPSAAHLPVAAFVEPERFEALAEEAYHLGFTAVASAPYVRSSYHAADLAARV